MQPEERHDEHHEGEPAEAEDVLEDVELDPPQRDP
jgi:hypothetical protein